jgi:hypothetical protein
MRKDIHSGNVINPYGVYVFLSISRNLPYMFIHVCILVKSLTAVSIQHVEKHLVILVVWPDIGEHIQENAHTNVKTQHARRHSLDARH